jgi:ABC-type xylose transport system permease subunit
MENLAVPVQSNRSLKALGIILEAWEEGADAGVAPEMMAYAALFTGLTDLVGAFGEDAVAALLGRLVSRVENGEFSLNRSLQ